MKTTKWLLACLVLGAAASTAACSDDGDDGADSTASAESAGETGDTDQKESEGGSGASVEDVQMCLEGEGWTVQRGSSSPEELQEAVGMVDFLGITVTGDSVGVGGITFYEDEDAAEEGVESAGLVRTDEVVIERAGTAVYTYAGDGDAADRIGACL